jgi:hypothetical protein
MGPLNSMKYGAIVKALYNFSKKYQNYGKFVVSNFNGSAAKPTMTMTIFYNL